MRAATPSLTCIAPQPPASVQSFLDAEGMELDGVVDVRPRLLQVARPREQLAHLEMRHRIVRLEADGCIQFAAGSLVIAFFTGHSRQEDVRARGFRVVAGGLAELAARRLTTATLEVRSNTISNGAPAGTQTSADLVDPSGRTERRPAGLSTKTSCPSSSCAVRAALAPEYCRWGAATTTSCSPRC